MPLIATLSVDHKWIAASFTRDTGNVWSNPELTCQHVDPQVALSKDQTALYEVKILIFRGSLEQAREKVLKELPDLKESLPTP
jgi:anion-transporting  ArsA/GET3 family ATPase